MQHFNKPVAAICLAVASAFVQAQQSTYDFDIPAQPAGQVLDALAKQTGLQPFYAEGAVKGTQSSGVKGRLSLRDALDKALAGTGLTYQFTGEKAVAIKAAPAEKVAELAAIEVKGELGSSYTAKRASAATKTDTPIMDTPFSIQVIPRQVIDDQQSVDLRDALRNVSGIITTGEPNYDGVAVRGFNTDGWTTVYRNGLRIRRAHNNLANIENIEVLKGPAGALYGRIEPGGLINLVTKQPQTEAQYSVEQQVGSNDFYRTTLGATGPLNEDRTLLYRLDVDYKTDDTFVDNRFIKLSHIAPAITWRPSTQTEINFNIDKQSVDSRYWVGVPVVNGKIAEVPISRFYGFDVPKDQSNSQQEKTIIGFDWSHKFGDDWMLKHRFHKYTLDYSTINNWWISSVTGSTISRGIGYRPYDVTTGYATNFDLTGRFNLLGFKHNVLVGFDYFDEHVKANFYSGPAPIAYRNIDIYNPVHSPINPQVVANKYQQTVATWAGFYFQDQITLSDQWEILIGGRYDGATAWSGTSIASFDAAEAGKVSAKDHKFNPRFGVVYKPRTWLSLYGNYSESMAGANTGTSATGSTFDPETAQQMEAGLKVELLDKKLTGSLALYDLTKQNVKTSDPANPGFNLAIGEVRSRGFEMDMRGDITNKFSVVVAYAYTDAEITQNNNGNQGNQPMFIPKHSGSLWGNYAFGGDWHGLTLGAGVVAVGCRYGNDQNTWILPGYGRADLALAYSWKSGASRLTTQLKVNNVFDKVHYVTGGFGDPSAIPGMPRTITASIKADF